MPKGKIGPNTTEKILPWVEMFWHNHKRYPSNTEFMEHFSISLLDYDKIHASKFYNICLEERGISPRPNLTPEQVAAVTVMSNFTDPRPNAVKLEALGITPEKYNGWLQDPKFKAELVARADEMLDNIYPDAQAAFAKQIRSGNLQALKMYYEITGRMQSPETINVKLMMNRVIEAVQKHVRDPQILAAIAEEVYTAERQASSVAQLPSTVSSLK